MMEELNEFQVEFELHARGGGTATGVQVILRRSV